MSVFGSYLIFYVVRGGVLEIRRVVHGARDLPGGQRSASWVRRVRRHEKLDQGRREELDPL